ncbi:MAG: pentapeptide repeat-containing protein [Pseudanabaenaceae cyanobacterium]
MSRCWNPSCGRPIGAEVYGESDPRCPHCGAPAVLIARYRLESVKSETVQGRVLVAWDGSRLDAPCVLYELKTDKPELASRARKEALRLRALGEHGQLPTFLDYFALGSKQYLVCDRVPGHTLAQEVGPEHKWNEPKIWQLLRSLLPVLQFLAEKDACHGAIAPAYLWRSDADGRLMPVDYCAVDWLTEATSGELSGFLAPEVLRQGVRTPRSDLFGLGMTCVYLLGGIPPGRLFAKYGFGWLNRWQQCVKVPLSQALVDVLGRLLQVDPERRYASPGVLLQNIDKLSQTQATPEMAIEEEDDPDIAAFLQDLRLARGDTSVPKAQPLPKASGTLNRGPLEGGEDTVVQKLPAKTIQGPEPDILDRPPVEVVSDPSELLARYAAGGRDFEEAQLEGANLEKVHLISVNLNGANLRNANLAGANLAHAKLLGTDLRGANLSKANLIGISAIGVKMDGANLTGANATLGNFSGAQLTRIVGERADFSGTEMYCASFVGARLDGALFRRADLTDVDFTGASLKEVRFQEAKTQGTKFPLGFAVPED